MSGLNGRGPRGQGPRTGLGRGRCRRGPMVEGARDLAEADWGAGRGRGRGWGRGAGRGVGWRGRRGFGGPPTIDDASPEIEDAPADAGARKAE